MVGSVTWNARAHLYGMRGLNSGRKARDSCASAVLLRAEGEDFRGLPLNDAAKRIETERAERELAQQQAEHRHRLLSSPEPSTRQGPVAHRERGIGF